MSFCEMPDATEVWVPGVGVTTLGAIRRGPEPPALADPDSDTVAMWGQIAVRNLCRSAPCLSGDTRSGPRASTG